MTHVLIFEKYGKENDPGFKRSLKEKKKNYDNQLYKSLVNVIFFTQIREKKEIYILYDL